MFVTYYSTIAIFVSVPVQHPGSCPVEPILFKSFAIVALENLWN